MKKVVCTIEDLLKEYGHLYHYAYSHHFKEDDNYMPLSKALSVIGYELSPEDREFEGEYGDIKGYYGCGVCKIDGADMDDKELTKYFNDKFKYASKNDLDNIWNLICEESLSLVGRKNGKIVEEIGLNIDSNKVYYRYEDSSSNVYIPFDKITTNLKVIN